MAITRDEIVSRLYYRMNGEGRRLCKCSQCGNGPMSIAGGAVAAEHCDECKGTLWFELTEQQFASEIENGDLLKLQSDFLASQMGDLYEADTQPEEWSNVLREVVEALEGFGDEPTARWLNSNSEKHPKLIEYLLDELYTRDFLEKARKMVDSTMKLSAMITWRTPDPEVNIYLREATRCYIAGFLESSVALSRSALEIALRHRLEGEEGFPRPDDEFEINDAHEAMAEEVRKHGNHVARGSPANEGLAERMLSNTRGVTVRHLDMTHPPLGPSLHPQ
jgi:hypothetical protein